MGTPVGSQSRSGQGAVVAGYILFVEEALHDKEGLKVGDGLTA